MSALWVGGRFGALLPFGNAYDLGYDIYGYPVGERWDGLASSELGLEGDVGARFARRYIVYGFWEHGFMGTGGDSSWNGATGMHLAGVPPFGEQRSATTDFTGAGFRWSSRPDAAGIVVDLGLGYRWFRESWASGASMTLKGFGEFRIGFGADVRVNRMFSVSPLFTFSTGNFHDRKVMLPGQPEQSIASYAGTHGTVTLTIGGHFDLVSSY
jgi:hypothetical protein